MTPVRTWEIHLLEMEMGAFSKAEVSFSSQDERTTALMDWNVIPKLLRNQIPLSSLHVSIGSPEDLTALLTEGTLPALLRELTEATTDWLIAARIISGRGVYGAKVTLLLEKHSLRLTLSVPQWWPGELLSLLEGFLSRTAFTLRARWLGPWEMSRRQPASPSQPSPWPLSRVSRSDT